MTLKDLTADALTPVQVRALIAFREGLPLTYPQFCFIEGISETTLHKMQKEGRGPPFYIVPGTKTAIRIAHAAHLQWRAAAEQNGKDEAAQIERERRVKAAQHAGKRSAASDNHISKRRKRPR
jgi:hypothetical protein